MAWHMTSSLSVVEKLDWLQLCRSDGVGPRTFDRLLERCGSAKRALEELPRLAAAAGGSTKWRRCRREAAEAELAATLAHGAALIAKGEPAYPARLAEIADPPPVLTVWGDPAVLQRPAVALVGARNASANGRMLARRLAQELAESGLVVVSGLARGIDTAAHEGALAGGGATVAVIAAGIDIPYPAENAGLMAAIARQGAVLTERPFGSVPQARHFPKRNRLIAGLALGVVVVEAAPNSGSLITARLAAEQGREVMAIPGSPLDPRHRGTNQLLRDGATLVEDAADIRRALGLDARPPAGAAVRRGRAARSLQAPAAGERPGAGPANAMDRVLAQVWERLGPEPLLVDELIRQCHATGAAVQDALVELELAGRIERHPGNRVSLAST
jgi:DNA processing protein